MSKTWQIQAAEKVAAEKWWANLPRNRETGSVIYDLKQNSLADPVMRSGPDPPNLVQLLKKEVTMDCRNQAVPPDIRDPNTNNESSQLPEAIDIKVESLSGGTIKITAHISNSTRDYEDVVGDVCSAFEAAYRRAERFLRQETTQRGS